MVRGLNQLFRDAAICPPPPTKLVLLCWRFHPPNGIWSMQPWMRRRTTPFHEPDRHRDPSRHLDIPSTLGPAQRQERIEQPAERPNKVLSFGTANHPIWR